ncbi:MAG: HAD family hydrolase [Bacillus sp. (in: firmicutes)]
MIKNILFDFDGVIIDSMPTKTEGFRKIFSDFEPEAVQKILDYNNLNGGLSRYVKIRYFFEEILSSSIEENEVLRYADDFSKIVKKELTNKELLIAEVVDFLQRNHKNYRLHIVSGADEKELQYLCKELGVDQYFLSIHGSPTHKNELVKQLLEKHKYDLSETILIGDSINDHEAAEVNKIGFYGYNNPDLKAVTANYLEKINDVFH